MNMKPSLTHLVAFLFVPLAMLPAVETSDAAARPNIIFILADDLGWRDVGCFGGTSFETPNIDRLAAQGVRLTNAYAASPICSPTRASILTGLHPARLGITGASGHREEVVLDKKLAEPTPKVRAVNAESVTRLKTEYVTLPEALREAGYATAHFGKWHVGHNLAPGDRFEPKDQGFDIDFPHTPTASGPGGGYLAPWEFIKDPDIKGRPGEHIDDRMADEAAKFIAEHKDRPFFVNFWAYSVHSPYNARRDYLEHFQAKADGNNPPPNPLYAAMVKSLDDSVGRLMDAVDKAGLADRTIFVFFSDNGGWAAPPKGKTQPRGFESLPVTSNRPLASGKASIYEGGTRVPGIVVWPGRIKPGTVDAALFQSVDWFPTLLAMCGLPSPPDVKFDGVDQVPALLGKGPVRDRVFCHYPHGAPGSHADIPGYLPAASVRLNDWKLIRFFADNDDGSDRFELFNLTDDPGEAKNLAGENPERVGELNELLTGFLRDTEAVIPVHNTGYNPSLPAKRPKAKAKAKAESGAGR